MYYVLGILYAFLWATGAIAAKIGLLSSSPLIFASTRLVMAGIILFIFVYIIKKSHPYPKGRDWYKLLILGILNTTLYAGCSFLSLNYVDSTIFNLFITINPFIVVLLSIRFLNRKISRKEAIGMIISACGLIIALLPYKDALYGTLFGLLTLGVGILSMGIGSVYFKKVNLDLPRIVINTWQIILGSIVALPFTFILEPDFFIQLDLNFIIGLAWQVIVISIIAMLLWFYLLKDPVRANNFLFLTPIFGYILGALFLNEVITTYHYIGAGLVVVGLILSQSDLKLFQRKR